MSLNDFILSLLTFLRLHLQCSLMRTRCNYSIFNGKLYFNVALHNKVFENQIVWIFVAKIQCHTFVTTKCATIFIITIQFLEATKFDPVKSVLSKFWCTTSFSCPENFLSGFNFEIS